MKSLFEEPDSQEGPTLSQESTNENELSISEDNPVIGVPREQAITSCFDQHLFITVEADVHA